MLLILVTAFTVFKYRQLKRSGESLPFLFSQMSAMLRQTRYLVQAPISAGLSYPPVPPMLQGTQPLPLTPSVSSNTLAETETTLPRALSLTLHHLSLHRGGLEADALAPTLSKHTGYLSPPS